MADRLQVRRDTAANWTSSNPTLSAGEWGQETDTGKIKKGDGSTAWNSLAYEDANYFHTNVAGEINGLSEKASPVSADILIIEDSAASNGKKKVQVTNLATGTDSTAIHDNVAGEINAITEKSSPVDADLVIIEDSEDSNNKKKAQLGNLPGGGGGGTFGSEYNYTESTGESSHSASFDYLKVQQNNLLVPAGDYTTLITGEYKSDGSGTCMVTVIGPPGSTTIIQPVNSTSEYRCFGVAVKYTQSPSGTFIYQVKWKRSSGSGTVYIRNVRIRTFRVS